MPRKLRAPAAYGRLATHSCGAPVLLVVLHEPCHLAVGDGPGHACEAALLPAGLPHRLDARGLPIACLWLEPAADSSSLLTTMIADRSDPTRQPRRPR